MSITLPPENVWDYPRPPRLERVDWALRIDFGGVTLAQTTRAHRILETSHPPTYYIPQADIRMDLLTPAPGGSFCEFRAESDQIAPLRQESSLPDKEGRDPRYDDIVGAP